MKIGVITFLTTKDNYGQVLQAWALQQVLIGMGHDAYVIQYDKEPYHPVWWKRLLHPIKQAILSLVGKNEKNEKIDKKLLTNIDAKNQCRHFEDFKQHNIKRTKTIYHNLSELKVTPPVADCYITGSDQVWAQVVSDPNNKAYFLDFVSDKVRRIAYAPSFAMAQYPQKLRKELQKLLSRFNYISVREPNGLTICSDLGYSAELVLDPTLLLDGNVYKQKFVKQSKYSKPFIFIYSLNIKSKQELYWNQLSQYASANHLNVTVTPSTGVYPGVELFDDVTYSYATIEEWLSNIANSRLVVTSSFHGIVLSILMEKNFVYIPLQNSFSRANDRVMSLLQRLLLTNKVCSVKEQFKQVADTPINWQKVSTLMSELREKSMSFLIKALK